MNNVLLDPLPEEWRDEQGNVYKLDTDFRIGIQICLIQEDEDLSELEKTLTIRNLLFDGMAPDGKDLEKAIEFYISGWSHDKPAKKEKDRLMDFDVDQWRIYAAFRQQYHIDLSRAYMHWWEFMGLLSSLNECAYTRVVDIRQRKFKPKMSKEERKTLREAKDIYVLDHVLTAEEKEFASEMDDLLGTSAGEKERIEKFESYGETERTDQSE